MTSPRNTRFALAVHLLTILGGDPARAQSSEVLAEGVDSNPVHVRRVLGLLREAGLVGSRNGPGGGWTTTGPVAGLTLADVWDAVHGQAPLLELHAPPPACPVGRSVTDGLVAVDAAARAALRDELARTTIGDMVDRVPAAPAAAAG